MTACSSATISAAATRRGRATSQNGRSPSHRPCFTLPVDELLDEPVGVAARGQQSVPVRRGLAAFRGEAQGSHAVQAPFSGRALVVALIIRTSAAAGETAGGERRSPAPRVRGLRSGGAGADNERTRRFVSGRSATVRGEGVRVSRRYAVLAPDWQLRGYADAPAVLVDRRTGEAVPLSAAGSYVARSCDGLSDFTSPYFLPRHVATFEALLPAGWPSSARGARRSSPARPCAPRPTGPSGCSTGSSPGRCNEVCRHCYMDAPSGRYGELPTADMLRLLDQFEAANVQRVHLTGGECLLRADIWELIAETTARRIGIHQLSTNGLLLDDAALARLRGLGVDPIVHLSFDGVGTHDSMRGLPEVEDAALETIRRTAAAGFRTAVTSCLDAETRDGILRAFDVLAEAGVHTWHVHAPMPVGCWTEQTTALPLAESAEVCEALLRRWLDGDKPFAVTLGSTFTGLPAGSRDDGDGPGPRSRPTGRRGGSPRTSALQVPVRRHRVRDAGRAHHPVPAVHRHAHPGRHAVAARREPERGLGGRGAARPARPDQGRGAGARTPSAPPAPRYGECGAGCWALGWAATGDRLGRDPEACETTREGYGRRLAAIAAEADSQ